MSLFGSIMSKIFHPAAAAPGDAPATASPSPATPAPAGQTAGVPGSVVSAAVAPANAAAAAATQSVDVGAVLSQMAAKKAGGGNYQTSIVDLLKLLDLDSSLDARKGLAQELSVHAGADGTAEQNIALHKAVMQKLAENGGHVPDSLKG